MFMSIYTGLTQVDQDMKNAARTLGAKPSLIVRAVIFPSALPQIMTGIKTGIGVAWFNVIAAELIGVRAGLGYKIQLNRTLLLSENVIGIMIVIGILGFAMTRIVGIIGKLLAPWSIQDDTRMLWIDRRRKLARPFSRQDIGSETRVAQSNVISSKKDLGTGPINTHDGPILDVRNLSMSFEGDRVGTKLEVLRDVSFSVNHGDVFSILGPNGSGKTTIINIVAGLLEPVSGSVEFMKKKVLAPSHERTVVFQNLALLPWRTCKGNINFALEASASEAVEAKNSPASRDYSSLDYLREAGLADFADTFPMDLSGGMKQQLALARALAASPKMILMDEPFASFDPLVRERSQETILSFLSNRSTTTLLITHDLDEAIFMSDYILVLSQRPGKIKEIVRVPFKRPRVSQMRLESGFHELRSHLWELLRSTSDDHTFLKTLHTN